MVWLGLVRCGSVLLRRYVQYRDSLLSASGGILSFTYSLTRLLAHSLACSLTRLLTHSLARSLARFLIYLPL